MGRRAFGKDSSVRCKNSLKQLRGIGVSIPISSVARFVAIHACMIPFPILVPGATRFRCQFLRLILLEATPPLPRRQTSLLILISSPNRRNKKTQGSPSRKTISSEHSNKSNRSRKWPEGKKDGIGKQQCLSSLFSTFTFTMPNAPGFAMRETLR